MLKNHRMPLGIPVVFQFLKRTKTKEIGENLACFSKLFLKRTRPLLACVGIPGRDRGGSVCDWPLSEAWPALDAVERFL